MVYETKNEYTYGVIPKDASAISLGVIRVTLGFVWIWAFLDKLLGLGFATTPEKAWINGGSPITGFLMFGTNPESPFYNFFAETLVNIGDIMSFALMAMFLFVGISLISGIFIRLSSFAGIIFMMSIWLAAMPLGNNPIVDNHLVYALVLVFFIATPEVGKYIGIGNKWQKFGIVEKYPILK